jgi:dihydropteroate synthase
MFKIPLRDRIWEINQPQIMGILNATNDSFFEESRVQAIDLAIQKASEMIAHGANILDIGGQSTRPNAKLYTAQEELNNVLPIIEALHVQFPNILISVDTYQSLVAEAALNAGAVIVNDISCGSFDPAILPIVARYQAGYIGMHLSGTMQDMHAIPEHRDNIIEEIIAYFKSKNAQFAELGITNWVMDPGFGFGKSIPDNFNLVKYLKAFEVLQMPILLGVSRKSSIYKTLHITAQEALNGTTVVNTIGLLNGASILRVHDVKEAKQIIDLLPNLS